MKCYRFVDAEKVNHAVALLCRVLHVSRAGFYAWLHREPSNALTVVEDLHPLEDRLRRLLACPPGLAIHQLGLQRGKEALRDRVVVAIPSLAHRRLDPVRVEFFLEVPGSVLAASIAVMDQCPADRASTGDRHGQGVQGQLGAQMIGQRPADAIAGA